MERSARRLVIASVLVCAIGPVSFFAFSQEWFSLEAFLLWTNALGGLFVVSCLFLVVSVVCAPYLGFRFALAPVAPVLNAVSSLITGHCWIMSGVG
jgi:hypothetical protein